MECLNNHSIAKKFNYTKIQNWHEWQESINTLSREEKHHEVTLYDFYSS